jgi:hypothetical protein
MLLTVGDLDLLERDGEQLVAHAEHAADGDHDLRDAPARRIFEHEVLHLADLLSLRIADLGADDLACAVRALPRFIGVLHRLLIRFVSRARRGAVGVGLRRCAGSLRARRAQREREACSERRDEKRCSMVVHGYPRRRQKRKKSGRPVSVARSRLCWQSLPILAVGRPGYSP